MNTVCPHRGGVSPCLVNLMTSPSSKSRGHTVLQRFFLYKRDVHVAMVTVGSVALLASENYHSLRLCFDLTSIIIYIMIKAVTRLKAILFFSPFFFYLNLQIIIILKKCFTDIDFGL